MMFKKRPPAKINTAIGRFDYTQGYWQATLVCKNRTVSIVVQGDTFECSLVPPLERLLDQLETACSSAVALARSDSPWPEEYGEVELEQIVFLDPAKPSSFLMQFHLEGNMPPIFLEVGFSNAKPERSEWEYI